MSKNINSVNPTFKTLVLEFLGGLMGYEGASPSAKADIAANVVPEGVAPVAAVVAPAPCWVSAQAVSGTVNVFTLASPEPGKGGALVAQGRPRTPLAGGCVLGAGKSGALLNAYIAAVNGFTTARVLGLPLRGHVFADSGRALRFGLEANLDPQAYNRLVAAIGKAQVKHGDFQILVTAARTAVGPTSKKWEAGAADFDGEFVPYDYVKAPVRELRAPVVITALEVITPDDPRWVVIAHQGLDDNGVITYGADGEAEVVRKSDVAKLVGAAASLGGARWVEPTGAASSTVMDAIDNAAGRTSGADKADAASDAPDIDLG